MVTEEEIEALRKKVFTTNNKALSDEVVNYFIEFNNKLIKLEEEVYKEALDLFNTAKSKTNSVQSNLNDCFIRVKVTFLLSKRDPNYDSNYNNIIAVEDTLLNEDDINSIYRSFYGNYELNNTLHIFTKDKRILELKICHLTHCLCDHNLIPIHEVNRIGKVYFDIKIKYQYISDFSK